MSDGAISAVPAVTSARPAATDAIARIVALPPNLPQDTPLQGEVTANAQGAVTIQTAQGDIVLELSVALAIGQQITVQVADDGKTIGLVLPPGAGPAPVPIATAPSVAAPALDPVLIHHDAPLPALAPLQARLVVLPPVFEDETLPVLIKSLAQLPAQQSLPPALADGLTKMTQLSAMLQQTTLAVAPAAATPDGPPVPKPGLATVITALQQIMQPDGASVDALAKTPIQNLVHLQTILPGQAAPPDTLVSLRQQIAALSPSLPSPPPLLVAQGEAVPLPPPAAPPVPLIALVVQPLAPPVGKDDAPPQALVLLVKPDEATPPPLAGIVTLPKQDMPSLPVSGATPPMVRDAPLPGTVMVVVMTPRSLAEGAIPSLALSPEAIEPPKPLHSALGETWPALEQIVEAAATQPPPVLLQTIPTPSAQHMPPAMLFFIAVLKNNLTGHWLQDPALVKLPLVEKSGALAQLAHDMQNIAARNDETLPADSWRPLPVPLQVGDQLVRMQWFYRHPPDDPIKDGGGQDARQKRRKTRFLLNVPQTGLGDIQLDGLVQEQAMELILRTENPLTTTMESAIRGRYQAALDTTGMKGALQFQAGRDLYVRA